jgi:hypothetical protein
MESSLTAALMKYGSDIQLKEKQKEIISFSSGTHRAFPQVKKPARI